MKFAEALQTSIKTLTSKEFQKRVEEEDEKMLKHLPLLQKINQHKFLTVNSQGGHKESGRSALDGKPYEISERAYLMGFMLEKDAEEFLKQMNIMTDKSAIFTPFCEDTLYLPSSLDIPVTLTKKGKQISVNTHLSSALPLSAWESFRKQAHINKSEPIVFVQCWDPKWNRNASGKSGLFTDVVKCLI